jgi:uncharacterized protein (TIGR03118 family)
MLKTAYGPRWMSAAIAATILLRVGHADQPAFEVHNLVSDGAVPADFVDHNLVNPWGLAAGPTTFWWVADNGPGLSTLYNGLGGIQSLVVAIPPIAGGVPSGEVYSGGAGFVVSDGVKSSPSRFIFATEDGLIVGWSPAVNLTNAFTLADRSAFGAHYKGLAIGTSPAGTFIYATNFGQGVVDVFDGAMNLVAQISDPHVNAGYAPFGIEVLGGKLYVTFALKASNGDDVAGQGHGFVDVFNLNGRLLKRLIRHGRLNSPWGLAMAPAHFGRLSNALLVGNFGDGHINAYDPKSGDFMGSLRDENLKPIVIDGLWALKFGLGFVNQTGVPVNGATNELFFTAGINGEDDGLFGKITMLPRTGSDDEHDGDGDDR